MGRQALSGRGPCAGAVGACRAGAVRTILFTPSVLSPAHLLCAAVQGRGHGGAGGRHYRTVRQPLAAVRRHQPHVAVPALAPLRPQLLPQRVSWRRLAAGAQVGILAGELPRQLGLELQGQRAVILLRAAAVPRGRRPVASCGVRRELELLQAAEWSGSRTSITAAPGSACSSSTSSTSCSSSALISTMSPLGHLHSHSPAIGAER